MREDIADDIIPALLAWNKLQEAAADYIDAASASEILSSDSFVAGTLEGIGWAFQIHAQSVATLCNLPLAYYSIDELQNERAGMIQLAGNN